MIGGETPAGQNWKLGGPGRQYEQEDSYGGCGTEMSLEGHTEKWEGKVGGRGRQGRRDIALHALLSLWNF